MANAKERWNDMDTRRSAVIDRVRECSKLTIPGLIPPRNHTEQSPLPTPFQSLGARGVNNISSKLLLALLPSNTSFFRFQIKPKIRNELSGQNLLTDAEAALAQQEQAAGRKVETTNTRPVLFEVIKHLVVAGNALLYMPKEGMRMFRMDQYVIHRKPCGAPICAIVRECVHPNGIAEDVKTACDVNVETKEMCDVYTCIEWVDTAVVSYQEINGKLVPGSEATTPADESEWLPLRWQAVPGNDYGRGLCEEYLGDLLSLEGLCEAVVMFSAAAAKIVGIVKPASQTSAKDLSRARSGDFVTGNPDDVSFLQIQKYADFQVAKATIDEITLRVSHAFLLQSGTVRNAERVTAEEIRAMAQELEDTLGGVYTVLSQELQLPFVRRLLANMRRAGELPALPKSTVEPVIVTGFDALGRTQGVNKLRMWLQDLAGVDPQFTSIKKDVVAKRLGVGYGVDDLDQVIKTPQEMQAEQQQAAQSAAAIKATPGVAQEVAKGVVAQNQ